MIPDEISTNQALSDLAGDNVVERIWRRDHTVWSQERSEISGRLGWLNAASWMETRVPELQGFTEGVIGDKIDHFVLLGMGGSSRAAKVIQRTFGNAPGYPQMLSGESTVPATIRTALERINPNKTLILISSKSGSTIEPMLSFKVFREKIVEAVGEEQAGSHFAAITDPGSPLAGIAKEQRFRKVFLNDSSVGGRFSAITYFGLVPAALLGVNVEALVDGGKQMRDLCAPGINAETNPAAILGATIGTMALRGRDKLTLVTSPAMFGYGLWVVQLVAESLGKDSRGVIPIAGEQLVGPELYGHDRLFVYLRLHGDDNAATDKAMKAVRRLGHPLITLQMQDREALGGEFFRWELAVAIAASILKVNPFDQPDVQLSKQRSKSILEKLSNQTTDGEPIDPRFMSTEPDTYEKLGSLLTKAKSSDYLGILAFLPHNKGVNDSLRRLRDAVLNRYGIATTLGHGPGYLHSTGQLHKGGPNSGIFLLLTAPNKNDVPIPGKPFTLGDVTDADAIGDLEALRDLGRRIVHVRLPNDSEESIDALTATLSPNPSHNR